MGRAAGRGRRLEITSIRGRAAEKGDSAQTHSCILASGLDGPGGWVTSEYPDGIRRLYTLLRSDDGGESIVSHMGESYTVYPNGYCDCGKAGCPHAAIVLSLRDWYPFAPREADREQPFTTSLDVRDLMAKATVDHLETLSREHLHDVAISLGICPWNCHESAALRFSGQVENNLQSIDARLVALDDLKRGSPSIDSKLLLYAPWLQIKKDLAAIQAIYGGDPWYQKNGPAFDLLSLAIGLTMACCNNDSNGARQYLGLWHELLRRLGIPDRHIPATLERCPECNHLIPPTVACPRCLAVNLSKTADGSSAPAAGYLPEVFNSTGSRLSAFPHPSLTDSRCTTMAQQINRAALENGEGTWRRRAREWNLLTSPGILMLPDDPIRCPSCDRILFGDGSCPDCSDDIQPSRLTRIGRAALWRSNIPGLGPDRLRSVRIYRDEADTTDYPRVEMMFDGGLVTVRVNEKIIMDRNDQLSL
jgi:hypothetical protein